MLSLARSRYTLLAQFGFLAVNAVGVLVGTVYNANTPDLYPNNAHHKLGWIVTWVLCAQVVVSLLGNFAGAFKNRADLADEVGERQSFIPVSTEAMAEHRRITGPRLYRLSNDSGQGTEPHTESLRGNSLSTSCDDKDDELHDEDLEADLVSLPGRGRRFENLAKKAAAVVSSRIWKFVMFGYNFVDRTILMAGSVTLCLGIVAYARLFVRALNHS